MQHVLISLVELGASLRHLRRIVVLAIFVLPALSPVFLLAQGFRVTGVALDAQMRPVIQYDSDAASYYLLYRGAVVTTINESVAAVLGTTTKGQIVDVQPILPEAAMFYRIVKVSTAAPLDTDKDGIDDVYELKNPPALSPLNSSDAGHDSGNGQTWLQRYLGAQPPVASFVSSNSVALSSAGLISVPVRLSRAYAGKLSMQFGGTALQGLDYQPIPTELQVNGNIARIDVVLVGSTVLRQPRSLLISLAEPAGGDYRVGSVSTHAIIVSDYDRGAYAGTLVFTNGLQFGTQPVKFSLRAGIGNTGTAVFDTSQSSFFDSPFSAGIEFSTVGNSFHFTTVPSGIIQSPTLGRPLAWTLEFGQPSFVPGNLTVPATLKVNGLSVTDSGFIAIGQLHCQSLTPTIP